MLFRIWVFIMFIPFSHLLLLRKVVKPIAVHSAKLATNTLKGVQKMQRVERIIANRGAGSRKEAEALIRRGLVVVNGEVIKSRSDRCLTSEDVYVDGVCYPAVQYMAVYHKPLGVLSSVGDKRGRPNLNDVIQRNKELKGMHPVGRLDADSTGLLLFSSDGKLTNYLLNPANKIDREYQAVVVGSVDYEKLKKQLEAGVETTDGTIQAKLLDSSLVSEEQKKLWFPKGIKVYHTEVKPPSVEEYDLEDLQTQGELELTLSGPMLLRQPLSVVNLTVVEGKYRMVRRILHNCGHSVVSLHRTRYGGIRLLSRAVGRETDDDLDAAIVDSTEELLPVSEVRYLTPDEKRWLQKLVYNRDRR